MVQYCYCSHGLSFVQPVLNHSTKFPAFPMICTIPPWDRWFLGQPRIQRSSVLLQILTVVRSSGTRMNRISRFHRIMIMKSSVHTMAGITLSGSPGLNREYNTTIR